ncbi:MAG: ferritin-like domain-containing protein [Microvirga sp.]
MMTLRDLLIEEMRDTYSSETQILQGLAEMAEAATSQSLKTAFLNHHSETQTHVERLNQAFEQLRADPDGNTCEATEGLIAEAQEIMEEELPGELLDVALIMAAQKVEHYEIASYGSLRAIAKECGESVVASLLTQTLDEEKATDEKLTRLAETEINKKAVKASEAA